MEAAMHRPPTPLVGPLKAVLVFQLERPARGKAAKRDWPAVRPDVERLASGILDQLQGIVYDDDGQVCVLELSKHYAEAPGVQITVEEL